MTKTAEFFDGTKHEKMWYGYHDALSLMTEKGYTAWMKEKKVSDLDMRTYYECSILPQLGLNDNIGSCGGWPVRNSPEFMPWDASLNNDAHETVRRHCVLS